MVNEKLVALLIITATTVAIIFLLMKFRGAIEPDQNINCAEAIHKALLVKKTTLDLSTIEATTCQSHTVTIKNKDLPNNDEKAKNKIRSIVAEELRKCWSLWGRGTYDIFTEEGNYCSVCSTIVFDDATKARFQTINNFTQYLDTIKAPTGQNYSEFLLGKIDYKDIEIVQRVTQPNIITQKDYVIFFSYTKSKNAKTIIEDITGRDFSWGEKSVASFVLTTAAVKIVGGGTAQLAGITIGGVGWGVAGGVGTVVGGAVALDWIIINKFMHGYDIISATYLIPDTPDKLYVQECEKLAASTVSP